MNFDIEKLTNEKISDDKKYFFIQTYGCPLVEVKKNSKA